MDNIYICKYVSNQKEIPVLVGWWMPKIPELGQVISSTIEINEAMIWQSCDGSDPTPEYKTNGVYFKTIGLLG